MERSTAVGSNVFAIGDNNHDKREVLCGGQRWSPDWAKERFCDRRNQPAEPSRATGRRDDAEVAQFRGKAHRRVARRRKQSVMLHQLT